MNGYSDRINHALAFAAKHHDQQVRRGTRPPYNTQPANVAIILTRYDSDEDTVVAGILLDVVEDYSRQAAAADVLRTRIADKFGTAVLEIALMAAERRIDDDGLDVSADERRQHLLGRLDSMSQDGKLLVAAKTLHGAGSLLADLRRTMDVTSVWGRVPGGRDRALDMYRAIHQRLEASGFDSPIVRELGDTLAALSVTPVPVP
jgi:HD domain-containing protein